MAYEKIAGRMPLWFFFFIASAGLLVVLSFPFDIFVFDFSKTNTLPLSFNDIRRISDALNDDFKPFAMIKYIGSEFPIGLTRIILVSLVAGAFIYLLYDVYQNINGWIVCGHVRSKIQPEKTPQGGQLKGVKTKDYVKWLRSVDQWGYLDFIGSMKMLTEGLLFGAETFCMLNVIRFVNFMRTRPLLFPLGIPTYVAFEPALWLIWSILVVAVAYIVYIVYYSTFKKTTKNLIKGYVLDELVTCEYCGETYSKRRYRCPYCGARRSLGEA
jgi:hypothetical protein